MVHISDIRLDAFARPTFTVTSPQFLADAVSISLKAHGRHLAHNATAAFTIGLSMGCSVREMRKRLAGYEGFSKRMEVARVGGVTIINDTYNANPDSVLAALDTLMHMTVDGDRIVVLGDMLELGKNSKSEHRAIGERIAELRIPFILTVGSKARDIHAAVKSSARYAQHYSDRNLCARDLRALAGDGDTILVKGSRGMAMESIVQYLHETLTLEKETA